MPSTEQEQKIHVNGFDVNYLKVGSGPIVVLLYPGALGSIWTDFKPQIEYFDRDKFTIVAWDPPGWGKSRPPDRVYSVDFYTEDAALVRDLMKALGYEKFSLIGWSSGGCGSLYIAALYPENVEKVVVTATPAYETPDQLDMMLYLKDTDSWSEQMKGPMEALYGKAYFKKTWAEHVDNVLKMCKKTNNDIVVHLLSKIKCPVLIFHGAQDVLVSENHPKCLQKNIKNSRIHVLHDGGHTAHITCHQEFNEETAKFLSSD